MKDFLAGFEIFGLAILPMIISLGACLARQAQYGWRGTRRFIREYVVCSFMGVIIYWGLDYFNFPPTVDAAITGGCSFASMSLLDALTKKITRIIRDYRVPGVSDAQRYEEDKDKSE